MSASHSIPVRSEAGGHVSIENRPWITHEIAKRSRTVPAYAYLTLPYVVASTLFIGYALGGLWNFLSVGFIFGIVPVLDALGGLDSRNPDDSEMRVLAERKVFRWLTWIWVPVQLGTVVWGAWVAASDQLEGLSWLGFTLSTGLITGSLGINLAHELGHKPNRFEQFLAKLLLFTVSYMHFFIEHNRGHHVHVSTPRDPASSRRGESLYAFLPRTLLGSYKSAWALEKRRLKKSHLPLWSIHNDMLTFTLLPIAFALALGLAFGPWAGAFFVLQSGVAVMLLETINYIEHYGLEREKKEDGRYERVNHLHSWNSNYWLTNIFLFMLQRHSDHHANPMRRYQTLRHFEESPQLPLGYGSMVLLALVPPLWRRVMDPRVDAFRRRLKGERVEGCG